MRRVTHVMQVIFWTSVPLFAVYLAVSWALGADPFAWPGMVLWVAVLISSAYLTPQAFPPVPREGEGSEARQSSESLVYPITLLVASVLFSYEMSMQF